MTMSNESYYDFIYGITMSDKMMLQEKVSSMG